MATETLLHESEISLDALRSVVLESGEHTCFFNLRELTRQEFVSVGSDGNILRWSAGAGAAPKWLIVPVDAAGHCKILTLPSGECMAVGSNGNLLRWADTRGPEQLFKFVNFRNRDRSYNILEGTKQEFVAVGSNGNILRWGATGGDEQRFILEPVDVRPPNPATEAQLLAGKVFYEPDAVPPHPMIADLESAPVESKVAYWIGVDTLPSVFVNDPGYSRRLDQVMEQPYYYLCRTRSWMKLSDGVFQKGLRQTTSSEVMHGSSCSDIRTQETTIGVVVGAKLGGEIGSTPGKGGGISKKVTGELSFQYSWQHRELAQMEQRHEEYHKESETVEFGATQECRLVLWQLVDKFSLLNSALQLVREPWLCYSGRTEWDIFPKQHSTLNVKKSG